MIIYVVERRYEGLEGVFSTMEKATDYLAHLREQGEFSDNFIITKLELDVVKRIKDAEYTHVKN
jgi:hypothetical protein